MADVPFEWDALPALAALRASDELLVVDPSKPAAQQPARIAPSLLVGLGSWVTGVVSLASNQDLTGSHAAIGSGLSVDVGAGAGPILILASVLCKSVSGSSSVNLNLFRPGVGIVTQNRYVLSGDHNQVLLMYVDNPGNVAVTYTVTAAEVGNAQISATYDSVIAALRL